VVGAGGDVAGHGWAGQVWWAVLGQLGRDALVLVADLSGCCVLQPTEAPGYAGGGLVMAAQGAGWC
jgi:hypothetical protein